MKEDICCPFCNKITVFNYGYYYCRHNNIVVCVVVDKDIVQFSSMLSADCIVIKNYFSSNYKIKEMCLYFRTNTITKTVKLPFDKSLTPENFEEKLNFYMMFQ
jgi:hypothetical protein